MFMETYTGLVIDPLEIPIIDVRIEDIAHALSLQCRYNGHCKEFYSIAQHSILVAGHIDCCSRTQLFGLLHDAAEAYLGDMIRPLKKEFPQYEFCEKSLQKRIYFGLCRGHFPTAIEQATIGLTDRRMLITEAQFLMPSKGKDWQIQMKPYPYKSNEFICWSPAEAEDAFLNIFKTLRHEAGQ